VTQKDNVLGNERNYSRRHRHKQTTLYTRNNKDGETEEEEDDDTERMKTMTQEITIRSKAEVLLYRSTLMIGSVAFALDQLSNSLYGSGLSPLFIEQLDQISHSISTWSILLSALVAPAYLGAITDQRKENEVNNALFLITNEVLPQLAGFAIFFEVLNVVQYYYRNEISTLASTATFSSMDSSSGSTLDNTTLVFISLLCFREIGFYGASYKAEAVLAILFSVAIALNDFIGLSDIALQWGLSLSLLVLSFAKVFEPIQDDLIPSGSAFFNDDF
jgi:uncharacterized integral membrane protein